MSDELLINVTPMECRVALIQNGTVNELFIERTAKRGLVVGNIYKGKVVRVLPGMQAAFVDIGLSRTAFLHINDMIWSRSQPTPNVFELLQPWQALPVQVMKDMLGTKGARLSTDLVHSFALFGSVCRMAVRYVAYHNALNRVKNVSVYAVLRLNKFRKSINYLVQ